MQSDFPEFFLKCLAMPVKLGNFAVLRLFLLNLSAVYAIGPSSSNSMKTVHESSVVPLYSNHTFLHKATSRLWYSITTP